MPAEIITKWLKTRRYATINGIQLRPQAHPHIPALALSVQKGQAETFFLESADNRAFVLKKLYPGKFTGMQHLQAVGRLLPQHSAFESATKRKILTSASLSSTSGYYSPALARWLDNTILMPKIPGLDWSALADKLRNGTLNISSERRLLLCKNLSAIVALLEKNNLAHRDLSCGNVFIHKNGIKLIDFDSLYHPQLPIPSVTTLGSEGYMAPFAKNIRSTWCPQADRFALTILNIELLILGQNSPFHAEGGLLNQRDINNRSGKTIRYLRKALKRKYPRALTLFNTALKSPDFKNCPAPAHWLAFCNNPTGKIKSTAKPATRKTFNLSAHNHSCNYANIYSNDPFLRLARTIIDTPQTSLTVDNWLGNNNQTPIKVESPQLKIPAGITCKSLATTIYTTHGQELYPSAIKPISLPANPWED